MMQIPANKNLSQNARKLLAYLEKTAGNSIITGQHTQTIPMEEISYIAEHTGRQPKLRGFELLSYSPNINYSESGEECLTEVYENRGTLDEAFKWAKESGGIITFTFHWFSPLGGKDKSFYSENTDFLPSKVLITGTPERKAFYADMKIIAEHLKLFCDEDIPILWRPFHESDGTWFWWGREGDKIAGELYKLMFDYFVNTCHLDNLIWVWNSRLSEGYPGDEYVDVVSVDIYMEKYKKTDYKKEYEELINATSSSKVAALAEVGYIPNIEMLERSHIPWAYYMTWSKQFCIGERYNSLNNLIKTYNSKYAVTMEA